MPYILHNLPEADAEKLFDRIRWAINDILYQDFPKDSLVIFCPYYLIKTLEMWAARMFLMNNISAIRTLVFQGVEVHRGYDQENIIVSNSNGDYVPRYVIVHKITYTNNEIVVKVEPAQE
ncbi:hypothetical protein [Mucilaginibacter sp. CSA2-8R]|uniref:hypothetical protein n=1 Tax=Mucilaginibacter sp. CSA2-8R TaxID=3141542 RepID=UPI00315DEF01